MTPSEAAPLEAQDYADLRTARQHARRSTAPARERSGALALTADGGRFPGVAVRLETAAGLSVCAEQVALCAARAATDAPIQTLVLWVPAAAGGHPCGQCLQVWRELAPQAPLLFQRGDEPPRRLTIDELLPEAFVSFPPPRTEP